MTPSEELQADAERFSSRYFEGFKKAVNRYGTCTMRYCKDKSSEEPWLTAAFVCSGCSRTIFYTEIGYRFCPYCGAQIERFECLEGETIPYGWGDYICRLH